MICTVTDRKIGTLVIGRRGRRKIALERERKKRKKK
jgi:hypothetical protein